MIFQADAIDLIRQRRKTQTRRPVQLQRPPLPEIPEKTCRYHPGRVYSVQPGRGQRGVLQITVMDVRQELLGAITSQDARREGFQFTSQFMQRWEHLHGLLDPEQPVWVISFAVGDQIDHFDRPRLLAATPGHVEYETSRPASQGAKGRWRIAPEAEEHQDYTDRLDRGARGEPEAVPANIQKLYTRDAQKRDDVRRRTLRAETSAADQLRLVEQRAQDGDSEAQRALYVINQRLAKVMRGESREAAA